MSLGILERVHDADSLANLLKAGLITSSTPLKVVFRDKVDDGKIQLIKRLNVTHITCESGGDVDEEISFFESEEYANFKEISSLRVLTLRNGTYVLSLPLGLKELRADSAPISILNTDMRKMKELEVMEINFADDYPIPPNLTRLCIKWPFFASPESQIPSTVTDLTFDRDPLYKDIYSLPSSLTKFHITNPDFDMPDSFSISQFPLLTDLEIPFIPSKDWPYLKTLPLTNLVMDVDENVEQLLPFLPESLTSVGLYIWPGTIDFRSINLPHLSTLHVMCEVLILPSTVTDLGLQSPPGPGTSIISPAKLRLESLRLFNDDNDNHIATFRFEGLTLANIENLKLLDLGRFSIWGLERLQKLTSLKLREIDGDLNARYPSVTSLVTKKVISPVVFPQKLSHLDVEKISAADVPLGLSSLEVIEIEVPIDYVFTAERWRNIVADKSTFNKLLKVSTPKQRRQLEKLVQEAW